LKEPVKKPRRLYKRNHGLKRFKQCSLCRSFKLREFFHLNKTKLDGYNHWCFTCVRLKKHPSGYKLCDVCKENVELDGYGYKRRSCKKCVLTYDKRMVQKRHEDEVNLTHYHVKKAIGGFTRLKAKDITIEMIEGWRAKLQLDRLLYPSRWKKRLKQMQQIEYSL
jgi:hypothetical protein